MGENSTEKFIFSFGGGKQIDAVAFAETVKEIVNLLQISAKEYDDNAEVRLDIHANQEGSFESILEAIVSIKNYAASILPEINTSTAKNIVGTVKDIFDIRKHLKGKKAKKIQHHSNATTIENEDGELLEKPRISTTLATENKGIQQSIVNITNIVIASGRTNFSISTDGSGKTNITSEEYATFKESVFDADTQTDDIQQQGFIEGKPYEDRLILLTQTVNDGGKWEFEDGESTIKVAIQDEDFLKRYQNQEVAILPRAVFKVVRKTDKRMTKGKWKSEYYILEVLGIEKERDLFSQQ